MDNTVTPEWVEIENRMKENQRLEMERIKKIPPNSKEYWRERAIVREKMDDPTYSERERTFCYNAWVILQKMEK